MLLEMLLFRQFCSLKFVAIENSFARAVKETKFYKPLLLLLPVGREQQQLINNSIKGSFGSNGLGQVRNNGCQRETSGWNEASWKGDK